MIYDIPIDLKTYLYICDKPYHSKSKVSAATEK